MKIDVMRGLFFTILLFVINNFINAQCVYTNSINISTGVDNTGSQLPIGVVDNNWELMNIPPLFPACEPTYLPFVIPPQVWTTNHSTSCPTCWANIAGTRALGPTNLANTTTAGGDNFNCNNRNGNQPFVYDRMFCLKDSGQVNFNLSFKGDDLCRMYLLDPSGNIIYTETSFGNHIGTTGTWNNSLNLTQLGTYRIRATNRNVARHSIGFSVSGNITANANIISNSSSQCCRDYGITIQKILDSICDGIYNPNDGDIMGGNGWNFDILSGGSIVANGTTDNNGELIVTGLTAGSYTIRENQNNSSSFNTPFQNNIQVTVGPNNPVTVIRFFNCPPPPPQPATCDNCCDSTFTIKEENSENLIIPIPENSFGNHEAYSLLQNQKFIIEGNSTIPITEFRAVVTDIQFESEIDECATCVNNPALWGTINGSLYVGNNLTNRDTTDYLTTKTNGREILWTNPNGAMLENGDEFDISFGLPPLSEIPCCATTIKLCMEISWKDANCKICRIPICKTIDLSNNLSTLNILRAANDKCSRTLTANTDGNASFKWSTGATSRQIKVYENGIYTVTATNGGTTLTQSIVVSDIIKGDFPLLSYNSLFHPENIDPFWESRCYCKKKILGICTSWGGCWQPGKFKKKFYIMDVSNDTFQGTPKAYNAHSYKLEIWHRWNVHGGQGNPLKLITGTTTSPTGFNNWDIFWDGTDQSGFSLKDEKADSYVWRLTLKNCTKESSKLKYKTTWQPQCLEYRYLFPKKKKVRLGCKKWGGYWKNESFEFGDVQMTK